ncbi:MAG: hydrogenase maturation nickel metallochaperone HypA [Bacteroidales bacterium]
MHELSIALGIVDLAQQQARANQAKLVTEIEIEIGKFAGVDLESLSFVLQSVIRGTELEGCRIQINSIPGKCRCNSCLTEFEVSDLLALCPACDSGHKELIAGKELRLKSILID